MVTIRLIVVDTGYFDELYAVDGKSTEADSKKVKQKFSEAIQSGSRIYVPVPVLFEFANHVASIKNIEKRKQLADSLSQHVRASINESSPWIISHALGAQKLSDLMDILKDAADKFAADVTAERFSLTDISVLREADHLKKSHPSDSLRTYQVHIWTRENSIKSREPDNELNSFI